MLLGMPVETNAQRLLKELYSARHQLKPVYLPDIAYELGISKDEVAAAWEYLRDQKWIKTYPLPCAASINEAGIAEIEKQS